MNNTEKKTWYKLTHSGPAGSESSYISNQMGF